MSRSRIRTCTLVLAGLLLATGSALADSATPNTEPMPSCGTQMMPTMKSLQDLPQPGKNFTPIPKTLHGITILIDFQECPYDTIPSAEIDDFMNLEGFTGFSIPGGRTSNGSVRDYFYDVSGGLLTYTNTTIMTYYTTSETYDYWLHAPMEQMNVLVWEALLWLDQEMGYDFSVHDADNDGVLDAVNVLTVGYYTFFSALHPHMGPLNGTLDGLAVSSYQNTHLSTAGPSLAVVCHENGHLLFGWPDLYHTAPNPAGNLSGFCLMSLVSGSNPPHPNAFLKWQAGWLVPERMTVEDPVYFLPSNSNKAAFVSNNSGAPSTEFYIFENRQQSGRDAGIADSGIAIYRVMNSLSGFGIVLVEADGRYDLVEGTAPGQDTDLWSAPESTHFDFSTTPPAVWTFEDVNFMEIFDISASSAKMRLSYGEHETAPLSVMPYPMALDAPWSLAGPAGVPIYEGSGWEDLVMPGGFEYTVTFNEVPYWVTSFNSPYTQFVPAGTTATNFVGSYGPPFAPVSGSDLSNTDAVIGSAAIDFDQDGDEDLFVINANGPNQLLRNEGNFSFTDVAPTILADADAKLSAWADVDGDGNVDVFLGGENGVNVLLASSGGATPTFTDVSSQTPFFDNPEVVSSASWVDIDGDGAVDLFLTRYDAFNVRLDGNLTEPFALVSVDAGFAENGASTQGAHWGDLNGDGWPDLFICSYDPSGSANGRLVMNNEGDLVHPDHLNFMAQEFFNILDVEFGDFNGDGNKDMVLLAAGIGIAQIYLQGVNPANFKKDFFLSTSIGASGSVIGMIETGDFDSDGYLDIYCGSETGRDVLAFNQNEIDPDSHHPVFTMAPIVFDGFEVPVTSITTLDYNNDGGLDVFVGRDGVINTAMLNYYADRGHWLEVELGSISGHPDAHAAKVQVIIGGEIQEYDVETGGDDGQSSKIVHFGLGDATVVDAVLVTWIGGGLTSVTGVAADQRIQIVEIAAKGGIGNESPRYVTSFRPAYPNPFNPATNIAFTLGRPGHVKAVIYAVDGSKVKELINDDVQAGEHVVTWRGDNSDGQRVASGTYFCRIEMDSSNHTMKLVLLK